MPQELPEDLIDALAGGSGIGLDPSKADDIIRELKAKGWDSDQFARYYLPSFSDSSRTEKRRSIKRTSRSFA